MLEAYQMNKKYLIHLLLLVFLFTAGLSLGQSANNTSIITEINLTAAVNIVSPENVTVATNESILSNESIPVNATTSGNKTNDEHDTIAAKDLKFIWSVTGIEADQITMVLDQDGGDLFGQAKYEPQSGKAWNAEVTGSIAGDKVDLTITFQMENKLISTKLSGVFDNHDGSISGNYTQVSLGKIVNKGSFTAMQISPNTSSYAPATIEEPKAETPPGPAVANTTASAATTTAAIEDSLPTSTPKSYYHDVRQDADRILTGVGDISQIPIGMGGSGLP
jgi:hypothetical protein